MKTNPEFNRPGRILLVLSTLFLVADSSAARAAEPPLQDPFAGAVYRVRDARTGRISSWDQSGGNRDFISFQPAETKELARLDGPGVITHSYLTCDNLVGGWWGEGDDMIFIDGATWPPAYHGTGTEEIFGGGACPNQEYAGPYTGFLSIHEKGKTTWRGQNSMYRWFVHEPIRFRRSIRWTVEHGHANNFENDYSSVAYWYQTEPHKPFPPLPTDLMSAGDAPAAPYPDHRDLSVYRDENGAMRPIRLPSDWAIRRRHVLAGMQEAMGPLPDRANLPPMDVQVRGRLEGDGFTRLTISFVPEAGDRLAAYLYLPAGAGPNDRRPAMLALHQTSALGKDEMASPTGPTNQRYADELARRGYVVLAPDYPSFGDSKDYDFAKDRYVSGTMKGIFNHMRCVDLLCERPEVDAARIGVIGHSLGGHNAMFVAAFEGRLKVIVSSCGWTPFHDYYKGDIKGWTSDRYMPLLRDKYGLDPNRVPFDFYEVVAVLAPRPFFSNSPIRDDNFDIGGVRNAVAKARAIYALLGNPDGLVLRTPDCQHDFPPEIRREAYRFIDKTFHYKPVREAP